MRQIQYLLFTFLCTFCEFTFALTDVTIADFRAKTPTPEGDWIRLIIPLKRAGNLILIEAKIDTLEGNFILDTGAPYLVLNETYFRGYASKEQSPSIGVSGQSDANISSIEKLVIGSLFYRDIEADITPMSHIEDKKKTRILGLLGTNLFSGLQIQIDLLRNQMVLYRLNAVGAILWKEDSTSTDSLSLKRSPDIHFKFKLCDEKIFVPVGISGQKMNWILDTGAETNVVDAWAKKKVMDQFVVSRRVNLIGSTGEKQEILLGVMPETTIGEAVFPMQQTIVTSMQELSETCSVYIDGILGYSFLSQGIFTLNFVSKEFSMYLYNTVK